jgi:hypothetical protein
VGEGGERREGVRIGLDKIGIDELGQK